MEIAFEVIGTPLHRGAFVAISAKAFAHSKEDSDDARKCSFEFGGRYRSKCFFFGLQLLSWLLNPSAPVVKRSNPNYEYPPTVNRHLLTKCRPADHFRHCQWRAWE